MPNEANVTSQDVAQATLKEIKHILDSDVVATAVKERVLVALLEHPASLEHLNFIAQGE